ncbi:MAG TPA: DUF5668 domain-containing protein [Candidatus Hydrothermia bacterium]|nr:hypothetical protein [Candidatus Hydrothermae bacterium]MDD3649100.1 DUF5668 domain-containing protein [Candidatus Hydrothermia bacterium]MDD5572925.1 DUF5668 domain-containing protein [Candidatus Hydrothermia bacterium]HOK23039.1 DUF5668 domain-containing protein [Candidatus Hydrothermia bacterium]HOL23701.1 DUF5668 domain-containing protein [Candidatus Hydrothermia bacterium]
MRSGGILLIAIGVIIWLNNTGIWKWSWGRDWPWILILIGIISIISHIEGQDKLRIIYKKRENNEGEEE